MSRPDEEGAFEAVVEALAGRRFALTAGASKVLRFMLEKPSGCDARIQRDSFEIRFGWHPSRHQYVLDLAPAAVSHLLTWAGATDSTRQVRAVMGPVLVPPVDFPSWAFGSRRLWLDATDDEVRIQIRDGAGVTGWAPGVIPDPLPEPIDYIPTYLEVPEGRSCPHCGASSTRYRKLDGGFLVCAQCGRSFRMTL